MTNLEPRLSDLVTVKEFVNKRTGLPIAAGILTIIAACACLIVGIIGLIVFVLSQADQLLIQGVIAVLAFAFGLRSGIMSLKRRHFAMSARATVNPIQVSSLDGFNGDVWVQNMTPTTFEIHIDMERAPNTLNYAFGWYSPVSSAAASQSSTSEAFSIQVQPAQSIYVCFELEKIASTINSANFQLQIVSVD